MKKSLLKASLICLGVTLLCGLYSFKTPDIETSQQGCQTAAISNDTVISLLGAGSQSIKKEVAVGGRDGCTCSIDVSVSGEQWNIEGSNDCVETVSIRCWGIVYGADGANQEDYIDVIIPGCRYNQRLHSESIYTRVFKLMYLEVLP